MKKIINKLGSFLHNMCYNNDTDDHDVINEKTKRLAWRSITRNKDACK